MAAKTYRTVQGDTFDSIAYRLWQDERQCQRLMQANVEYMDVIFFDAGVELNVPDYKPQPKKYPAPPWGA